MSLPKTQVKDAKGGEPVPAGTYRLELRKITAVDKPGKEPRLDVQLVITDDGEYLGRYVFAMLFLAPGKNFMLKKLCDALQLDPEAEIINDAGEFVGQELFIGTSVNGVVEVEDAHTGDDGVEYEARNKVKQFISVFG